jgi:hypothetical protein
MTNEHDALPFNDEADLGGTREDLFRFDALREEG